MHHPLSPIAGKVKWNTVSVVALAFMLLPATLWAMTALYFDVRIPGLRMPLVIAYLLALLAIWTLVKGVWRKLGLTAGAFLVVLAWWFSLKPSNDRDWQTDVAVLPYADIEGNKVTVHKIRNCDYRTETDYDVQHYDKTFDLDKLLTADLFMVYWGSPSIAHTMISF